MSRTVKGAQWAARNLARLTATTEARTKPIRKGGKPLTEDEQIRRFLAGEEEWRIEAGLISPADYARYQEAMLQKLGV